MAVSADYLASLKKLAVDKYNADVAVLEADMSRQIGGKVEKTGTGYTYKTPQQLAAEGNPGTPGALDIAYEQGSRGLEGGLESRGILKSGQAARMRGDLTNQYQQSVMDYYNAVAKKKGALAAQNAFDLADLEAKYGSEPQTVTPDKPSSPENKDVNPFPSSSTKPADQLTPEEAAAKGALGQPADYTAATGKPYPTTPTPVAPTPPAPPPPPTLPAPTSADANAWMAAAAMALGSPMSAPTAPVAKLKKTKARG